MTPPRLGAWASVLFLVSGCAGAAVRGEFDRQIAGVQATARAEADAQGPAGVRLRAWCMSQPAACQARWWAERLPTRLHWFRAPEPIPPYAVTWGIIREELEGRITPTLGQSYDWAVLGLVFEAWDHGEWTDDQAKALLDYHYQQRQEAMARYSRILQMRVANADRQDLAVFSTAVGALATGLNAYAASLPRQPRSPSAPAFQSSAAPPRPPATIVKCTYGLLALGGRQLCAMSDGSVISQMPPGEPTYRDLHPGTGR